MRRVFNIFLSMFMALILSCVLSLVIVKVYGYGFFEGLLWIGIIFIAVGGMSSISGNATGTHIFDGSPDSQYQSFGNIESLQKEREITGFYANFKKHGVFDPKDSSIGAILAGVTSLLISFFYG